MGMRCNRRHLLHRLPGGNVSDEVTQPLNTPGANIAPMNLDKVLFTLDAEKFEQFAALLNAPPAPNAALARLLAVQAPWVSDN
ncbi:DUF1778 domain-containing protein [Ramlibacter sp. G-1-2-2]|uniref:DUF1778 domain-containing protein n=1 Tax=Ramlibacter agri TaxID=2728837 RepID=A0A848HEE1_9BURK|nr:DUF1778 domain-containing protein [Ramlibacter agri]